MILKKFHTDSRTEHYKEISHKKIGNSQNYVTTKIIQTSLRYQIFVTGSLLMSADILEVSQMD